MEYVHQINFGGFKLDERSEQLLHGREIGGQGCNIRCIQVPPGGGSPAGRHVHTFEQIYYIISGVMDLEVDGKEFKVGPGSLVYLPLGVPHRNWNGSNEPVVHLALMVPEPAPGEPISRTVA